MEHINPDGLIKNPAFSQIIATEGNGKTIYIGGQNAVNEKLRKQKIKQEKQKTQDFNSE